ncbi:hypothetical protein ESCO10_00116 [Escherichia phage vB_EcoM_ESCO10]|nr:hypothetical protein ESCO10_00116 [Escherichia phage vB_EcoM_ESCO10]
MAITLSPSSIDVEYGDSYTVTANIPDISPGSSIVYNWTKNKKFISSGTNVFTEIASSVETLSIACRIEIISPDKNTEYILSDSCLVNVSKNTKADGINSQLVYSPDVHKIGDQVILSVESRHVDPGYIKGVIWKDPSGNVVSIGKEYTHKIKTTEDVVDVKIDLASENYAYYNKTLQIVLKAIEEDNSECSVRYIHPLDHRDSGYIWMGWWVMDEIERATVEGLNWKAPDGTDLKYKCDLKTLSIMLDLYNNVEVQESRNGYILNRADLLPK